MGDDKDKLPAGATIQIDLADVRLVDLEAAASRAPASRKAPPPLPPGTPTAGPVATMPRSEGRAMTAVHVGVVVLFVVVAVVAGLFVGGVFRGGSTTVTAPSAAAPSASHTAPVDSVLTIPPIEVR